MGRTLTSRRCCCFLHVVDADVMVGHTSWMTRNPRRRQKSGYRRKTKHLILSRTEKLGERYTNYRATDSDYVKHKGSSVLLSFFL